MKITESKLRQIIREEILDEAPLVGDGIYRYKVGHDYTSKMGFQAYSPSVGYKPSEDPEWRDKARVLMRNTAENWAIVTLSAADAYGVYASNDNNWKQFNQWIREQNIPKGTRIIVVGSPIFPDDYDSVAWAVGHDIFGHTLNELMLIILGSEPPRHIIRMIHEALPEVARLSTDSKDFLPDIYAAIFLKVVSREFFDDLIRSAGASASSMARIIDKMFEGVDTWITSIPVDEPHMIYPWNL